MSNRFRLYNDNIVGLYGGKHKMRPCPFCTSNKVVLIIGPVPRVSCFNCQACGPNSRVDVNHSIEASRLDCIALWNKAPRKSAVMKPLVFEPNLNVTGLWTATTPFGRIDIKSSGGAYYVRTEPIWVNEEKSHRTLKAAINSVSRQWAQRIEGAIESLDKSGAYM